MSDFNRGYFCAIAKLVKIEGLASAAAKELFNAGENPARADDDDYKLELAQIQQCVLNGLGLTLDI